MQFKKLKLKKSPVKELSHDLESLPLEATDQVAGGLSAYCTLDVCPKPTAGCDDTEN